MKEKVWDVDSSQEPQHWALGATLSIFLTLERGFSKCFLGCRARVVTLYCCDRDRENTLAQLCKFKYGFGENKLRQRMSMWHNEQYVFSKSACFVPACGLSLRLYEGQALQTKISHQTRALKGWTSSACAVSKRSDVSHINWDLSPSFRVTWSFACLDAAHWSQFKITSKNRN